MNALLCFSDKIIIKKFLYLIKIKKYKNKKKILLMKLLMIFLLIKATYKIKAN